MLSTGQQATSATLPRKAAAALRKLSGQPHARAGRAAVKVIEVALAGHCCAAGEYVPAESAVSLLWAKAVRGSSRGGRERARPGSCLPGKAVSFANAANFGVPMSPAGAMDQSPYRLEGDVAVIDVNDDIDVLTSSALRDRLLAVAGQRHDGLVVNLGNVDFIDSTGIGVLIGVWRRMQADRGTLALATPSRRTRRIFDIAGVSEILFIYDSVGEAVQACRRSPGG